MDPSLYYALMAAAGAVVSGGVTYWAGCRLLRLGDQDHTRDPAGEQREPGRPPVS